MAIFNRFVRLPAGNFPMKTLRSPAPPVPAQAALAAQAAQGRPGSLSRWDLIRFYPDHTEEWDMSRSYQILPDFFTVLGRFLVGNIAKNPHHFEVTKWLFPKSWGTSKSSTIQLSGYPPFIPSPPCQSAVRALLLAEAASSTLTLAFAWCVHGPFLNQ